MENSAAKWTLRETPTANKPHAEVTEPLNFPLAALGAEKRRIWLKAFKDGLSRQFT